MKTNAAVLASVTVAAWLLAGCAAKPRPAAAPLASSTTTTNAPADAAGDADDDDDAATTLRVACVLEASDLHICVESQVAPIDVTPLVDRCMKQGGKSVAKDCPRAHVVGTCTYTDTQAVTFLYAPADGDPAFTKDAEFQRGAVAGFKKGCEKSGDKFLAGAPR